MTALAEALVKALSEMPAVKDDKTADTGKFKYSYVTLDHLIAQTRPVLKKHGLAISQGVAVLDTGQPVLRTTILHSSGESRDVGEIPLFSEKSMQPLGGAITYARRYAWAAALGICAEEDDDAQSITAAPSSARRSSSPAAADSGGEPVGQATPAPPTADQLTALLKLVEERGGDTEVTHAAATTAEARGKLAGWYSAAVAHWEAQPVATEFEKKAADAVKAGGSAQAARAQEAQAGRKKDAA